MTPLHIESFYIRPSSYPRHSALLALIILFLMTICSLNTFAGDKKAASFSTRPKLIVAISIDQFRADTLMRFEKKFMAPEAAHGKVGGFRYLTERGAYFPYAEHEVLQAMTGPGHATILTGSYPYTNGIPINEWFDPRTKHSVYCSEDQSEKTVGGTDYPQLGTSPRQLLGTTVGDELKNAGYASKVVSLSLKDRASILMGGHRADLAFWFDSGEQHWASSTYYIRDQQLPEFLQNLNTALKKKPCDTTTICAADITTNAAIEAIKFYKLGRNSATDLLAISYSAHDFVGHRFGPNSTQLEEMTLAEDSNLAKLFQFLQSYISGGLQNVVIVLTGDHGVAPSPDFLKDAIVSGRINEKEIGQKIEDALLKKFGSAKNEKYLLGSSDFNFYLNHSLLAEKKIEAKLAEDEVKKILKTISEFAIVFSRSDWLERKLPPELFERQILKTYYPGRSGDVIALPKVFFVSKGSFANHLTGYTYDRTVPIVLAGLHIRKKVFAKTVRVVDIAPTLTFLSGTLPPALSEGRVLDEALDF